MERKLKLIINMRKYACLNLKKDKNILNKDLHEKVVKP